MERDVIQDILTRVRRQRKTASRKGKRRRFPTLPIPQLVMLFIGVVMTGLLVILMIRMMIPAPKDKNVTADEGLHMLILEEPESWCTSGRLVLEISAASAISEIRIDGRVYVPDKDNEITVDTDKESLEVEVATEKGVLNGSINVEKIDSRPPRLLVKKENAQVTLTAVDGRSDVEGIYYAIQDHPFVRIPVYQKYEKPLDYVEGNTYWFFARDNAGNCTVPVGKTLEDPEGISLSETSRTLFVGDSFVLTAGCVPEGAVINGITLTNNTPDILSLAEDGTVTALKAGNGLITASAEGFPSVTCDVEVCKNRTVSITAGGDCTLGTDAAFSTVNSLPTVAGMYGYDYFFQNLREIFAGDDLTFLNLEGPISSKGTRQIKQFAFYGDPEYVQMLSGSSVEAVTMANNHSDDYGPEAKEETQEVLDEAGIAWVEGDKTAVYEANGIKVGLTGIYVLDDGMAREPQVRETIASLKEQGAQVIVAAFHWGSENANYPDETQVALAHIAVDCGADLVVGHHPHVLQGIEKYKGKYIAYSLGNLCFGGNSNPSDKDTMLFQQTFTVEDGKVLADDNIRVIPCSISSDPWWNNYQPTPAQGEEAERIIGRINEFSAQFGMTYSQQP